MSNIKVINRLLERIHYFIDSFKATQLTVTINHFILSNDDIIVLYRLGRQKLLHKMLINEFEEKYFEKVSNYDQHRLTKLSTLNFLLKKFFKNNTCDKGCFISYIKEHCINEQLF